MPWVSSLYNDCREGFNDKSCDEINLAGPLQSLAQVDRVHLTVATENNNVNTKWDHFLSTAALIFIFILLFFH